MKFLILLLLITSSSLWAEAQWGIITTDRAVIYADVYKKSPIGYAKKGKKFKVGSIPRNNGELLPVVISGRIAYIEIEKINVAHDKKLLELPTEKYLKRRRKTLFQKDVSLFLYQYTSNLKSGEYDSNQKTKESSSTFGMKLQGLVEVRRNWKFGTSFSFENTAEGTQSLTSAFINIDSVYKFLNRYKYYLGHVISAGFAPYSQLKVDNEFTEEGQGYQLATGLEYGYLFKTFSIKLGAYYKIQTFSNFDLSEDLEDYNPTAHGLQVALGLAYNY